MGRDYGIVHATVAGDLRQVPGLPPPGDHRAAVVEPLEAEAANPEVWVPDARR
jgi:hypothetical protein